MSADRAELYRCSPPEGLQVPLLVQTAEVNVSIPSEAEIEVAVQGLKIGIAGGQLGIRAEDLKGWIREAKLEKEPTRRRWEIVVRLVKLEFRDGTMPEEIDWSTMVLLPKGRGEYQEIGLVEVL